MIKARGKGKDGKVLLMLGLSEVNLIKLAQGDPIRVNGAELGLLGHYFLLCCVRSPQELKAHHDYYSVPGAVMHTVGFAGPPALNLLKEKPVEYTNLTGLDARLVIFAGKSEAEIATWFGRETSTDETREGYRDVLDPLTGIVTREKLDKPS
jgi:hypothetical protein